MSGLVQMYLLVAVIVGAIAARACGWPSGKKTKAAFVALCVMSSAIFVICGALWPLAVGVYLGKKA